ncbi:cysteine proteinase [Leucogyrophana mollusca]|uniref:Cysteine proteinase n=1 Tax=Leucogyrophana mollusca TaxID=85980 RepID=A0ACB8BXX7_9AGAM|nr:cysteine proteinase [Leucogyrophana mollusca]
MPPKRKRRASPAAKGLAAGEQLKRGKLAGNDSSTWGWVDTEVSDPSKITLEHRLMTCGLSKRNRNPFCANKYASNQKERTSRSPTRETKDKPADGELDNDVIVISDDELPPCDKKSCRNNPNCLNHLGQEKWEDEDKALELFVKASDLGENPLLNSKDPNIPNLGATCYANAFLQVWFRDLAFRNGVYQCQPSQDTENKFEDSPIFQLQVTFAALQESVQNVFNPTKLVESLKLSTSEQQDAQEFSKLFMSHLDFEFQKQAAPALRSLIADQFQGQQVYGTICGNCHNKSERSTDFLEVEINIENNARLEDRVAALLQHEKLSGDNKYLCSTCNSLQDATRYTELRKLPPVLHFSLLRFVYDFSSMERKKSKHNLLFPTTLTMDHFVGSAAARKAAVNSTSEGKHVYELRGVLLHKGTSAYHGHYEAQVFDTTSKTWFQFDDETVTKIDLLGEKRYNSKEVVDVVNRQSKKYGAFLLFGSASSLARSRPAKKRRVEDSEDEVIEISPPPAKDSEDIFSSKDAYMLIYARKESSIDQPVPHVGQSGQPDIHMNEVTHGTLCSLPPPQRAMDVVTGLNSTHEEAWQSFVNKEKRVKEHFAEIRDQLRTIYSSWNVNSIDEDCVVVSRQALEAWIMKHLTKHKGVKSDSKDASDNAEVEEVSDILCSHDGLDPQKANNMKRISSLSHQMIEADVPGCPPGNVCEVCVQEAFIERLYHIEHPRIVASFDENCEVTPDAPGYWISKFWLRDWRLQKPKMHIPLKSDPEPDASDYHGHVKCEHEKLSLNSTSRRRISMEACELLKSLFPSWVPLSTDEELCPICEASIRVSKEDKREIRRRAEDEKARLRHMHDNALTGNTLLLENVPCAVIPAQFVRSWRQWLSRPTESPRPQGVDPSQFLCHHEELVFDPNCPNDLDTSIALIQRTEWEILEGLYPCGRLIGLEKRVVEDPPTVFDTKYVHDIPVCNECRMKRRSDYDLTELTIRILGAKDPIPSPDQTPHDNPAPHKTGDQREPLAYGSRKGAGTRQSKRIRQVKEAGEKRKLMVSKLTTVKDIKVMVHNELNIPTISQRLFYRGQELEDNSVTVESLGILINDVVDLREEMEDDGNLTESDTTQPKKRRREEKGFGGTLLGSSQTSVVAERATSSEREQTQPALEGKACQFCTLCNPTEAQVCQACEHALQH